MDSVETVSGTAKIVLRSADGIAVESERCFKAMRHVDGPWACPFRPSALAELRGTVSVAVLAPSGSVLLRSSVDVAKLRTLLSTR